MPRSGPGPISGCRRAARGPVVGGVEPGDDAQQRGLAAAGRAEDGDEVVVADREVGRLERAGRGAAAHGGEDARDVLDLELAHARLQGNRRGSRP